jgi:hypothetical protein
VVCLEAGDVGAPQHRPGRDVEGGHVVEVAPRYVERRAVGGDGEVVGEPVATLLVFHECVRDRGDRIRVDLRKPRGEVGYHVEAAEGGERVPIEERNCAGGAVADEYDIAQPGGRGHA